MVLNSGDSSMVSVVRTHRGIKIENASYRGTRNSYNGIQRIARVAPRSRVHASIGVAREGGADTPLHSSPA